MPSSGFSRPVPGPLRLGGLLAVCLGWHGAALAATPWEKALAERKQWWSLQPVQAQSPPPVADAAWSDHPVDRFLLAGMESRKLQPAADADARTVCRRLHFILTGLPPSAEESATFEIRYQAGPAQAVAERSALLMASPRFGERWARHWMDLMRYAETHGSEGDAVIPSAWRYRDYLIRAFNHDLPLDQLIREHLAGDLLPAPRLNAAEGINESLLGTAHFRLVEHGFQPIDSLDEQVKTVDSQIDVLSKAFQGLTISCARCHDHKFDAVSQRDYTALYGIIASARPGQVTIDSPGVLTAMDAELAALKETIRQQFFLTWTGAAAKIPDRIQNDRIRRLDLKEAEREWRQTDSQVMEMETAAKAETLKRRGQVTSVATTAAALPNPWARWDFEKDGTDTAGRLAGVLSGGAGIKNGRLVLNGTSAVLTTPPLPETITAKTLEAWIVLTDLDQGGGGVITLEKESGAVFDSLVFAEKDPRQWMAGSEFGRRSRPVAEAAETAPAGEPVHMACVYEESGGIRLYRNGLPCGPAYASEGPVNFPAGSTRVLLGQRHTGGANAFFAGEIEEARIYDRALNPDEIAASFQAGAESISKTEWLAVMSPDDRRHYDFLWDKRETQARLLEKIKKPDALTEAWDKALAEALTDSTSPLHPWAVTRQVEHGTESGAGKDYAEALKNVWEKSLSLFDDRQSHAAREEFTARTGARWIEDKEGQKWQGFGPHVKSVPAGGFAILPEGDPVLAGLDPPGHVSSAISTRQNGVLVSPRFVLGESLSVRAWGGGKARVRVIVDQYPLGNNATYPEAELKDESPAWIRFDTDYRKGSSAYLEFVTDGDDMMMAGNTGADRSWFGVSEAVVHTGKEPPPASRDRFPQAYHHLRPQGPSAWAQACAAALQEGLQSWQQGTLTSKERRFLDFFVRRGLLPRTLPDMTPVHRYRELEAKIPTARRAPGLLESAGTDVPLFIRGDHHKPAAVVPRGYLEVLGNTKIATPGSGRLELAEAIAGPGNPLTARVMANRIWLQVFGQGLVATPDDFGKMGTAPTHPELLDFLAAKLAADGWSPKKMLSFLLTSRAFRLACTPSDAAVERDAANDFLSHARVRRLEAEAIRDSLLTVSGQLDLTPAGPGDDAGAAPDKQSRRSVYLNIRRTNLPAFLGVFDMPVPFSTTGRRTVTTVPAQSLALLNDPFVIHLARRTASKELRDFPDAAPAERVQRLFLTLLGRPPHPAELEQSLAFLQIGGSHPDESAWADLVQSLFNAKEFIYLL